MHLVQFQLAQLARRFGSGWFPQLFIDLDFTLSKCSAHLRVFVRKDDILWKTFDLSQYDQKFFYKTDKFGVKFIKEGIVRF